VRRKTERESDGRILGTAVRQEMVAADYFGVANKQVSQGKLDWGVLWDLTNTLG
jgi:hypothetical protein